MRPTTEPGFDFETRQIHAGDRIDPGFGARVGPIYQTAGYLFSSFDDAEARFSGATAASVYSRSENPTNAAAGRRLADLEGGVAGLVVGSGQAAIAATLFALASSGDHILATESLYEGTKQLFLGSLTRQGLLIEFVPESASDADWAERVTPRTRALFTETIPNPKNQVVDLERLAAIAHRAGVPLVVDSTVATPYLCRPIEWGADTRGPESPPSSTGSAPPPSLPTSAQSRSWNMGRPCRRRVHSSCCMGSKPCRCAWSAT